VARFSTVRGLHQESSRKDFAFCLRQRVAGLEGKLFMYAWLNDPVDGETPMRQHRAACFAAPAVGWADRGSLEPALASAPTAVRSGGPESPGRSTDIARRVYVGPTGTAIVDLARAFVAMHLACKLEAATLVNATGVSESTLRRAVLAETGMQLSGFVLNIRLDQAHAWLSSNRESRSQRRIAQALGFNSAAAFARAYKRRFGETMTMTRLRAVRLGESVLPL
jgi:AraC-like DNA-binding protein